jgi:hypothetical protein
MSSQQINNYINKSKKRARSWWLMPIILASQEAEIRRL